MLMVHRCRGAALEAFGPVAAEIQSGKAGGNRVAQGIDYRQGASVALLVLERGAMQFVPDLHQIGEAFARGAAPMPFGW